jgi:hypothetical protein
MRVHVKPAIAGATIPDPSRGRDLPPDGAEVEWTAYWAGMEMRGDVIVEDVQAEPEPDPSA